MAVILINYFIPHKLAFLDFYFLPVILAGYFLGIYHSVMGAFFSILIVSIYLIIYPQHFDIPNTKENLYFHLLVWGGFLILAGAVVGKLQRRLKKEISQAQLLHTESQQLNEQLREKQEQLNEANSTLNDYSINLALKVKKRTRELEESKQAIERIKIKVEDTLYSTMDSSVAKLLIEGRLRDEKRHVSVMFTDLTSFTSYSERINPELVIRDLNRYLADMEPILITYKGHIDKYQGDGIMCEFGAPIDYENFRLMGVVAAIKMQNKMTNLGYPWKMRIGIASGMAIMGLIGSKRQSYTTIGDVVNLSSRLEKACPDNSILIDNFTLEGVRRFVDVKRIQEIYQPEMLDDTIKDQFKALLQSLNDAKSDQVKIDLYKQIGQLHMSILEATEAVSYFERALNLDPDNYELKIAFAEACIKRDQYDKIKIRGREQRVAAYEVIGIKDVFLDRERITLSCYERFKHVEKLIDIQHDVTLPVEVLDGSMGHSKIVGMLSYAIATELRVASKQEKIEIAQAGFLADIGKEVISHRLLNRSAGSLSATEFSDIQKHPAEGVRVLKKIGFDSPYLLQVVRHSHEHYNGAGIPDGLKGDDIPLGSRIVMVADSYDALTSWRPYQDSWDRDAAFNELGQGVKDGIYDPDVVAALLRVLI